jgi:hypothetical protein
VQSRTHLVTAAPEGATVVVLPKLANGDISMRSEFYDDDMRADTYSTKEILTPEQRARSTQKRR